MKTVFIIIGTFSVTALVACLFVYVAARFILWYFEPEVGSNAHLKEWLLKNPESSIDQYCSTYSL